MITIQLKELVESGIIKDVFIFNDALNRGFTLCLSDGSKMFFVTTHRNEVKVYKSINSLLSDYKFIFGNEFQQLRILK